MIQNAFFTFSLLVLLVGCAHKTTHRLDHSDKQSVVYRFQNTLGLQTTKVGCSLGNLGGLDLTTQHSVNHPVDLAFQIGPAFYPFITGPFGETQFKEERKKIWRAWEKQKVAFYAVDSLDLASGLEDFKESAKDTSIELISSNIRLGERFWPFPPFMVLKVAEKKIIVLSLTEASPNTEKTSLGWYVQNPVESFVEVRSLVPHSASVIYVLGSLTEKTRNELAKVSKEPILFLGGTRKEKNPITLKQIAPNAFWVKSPDYGMGFTELTVGVGKKTDLGGLGHEVHTQLVNEESSKKAVCEPSQPKSN